MRGRKYQIPESLIRDAHRTGQSYCSVARQFGCSGRHIAYLAAQLGLPPRRSPRDEWRGWTEPELEILRTYGAEEIRALQARLARMGSRRTLTAIQCKRWELRAAGEAPGREARDHYTQGELAELLGVDAHKVGRWIRQGKLAARKYGDWSYHIDAKALRAFLKAHVGEWDPGRCDKYWLVDVLVGRHLE